MASRHAARRTADILRLAPRLPAFRQVTALAHVETSSPSATSSSRTVGSATSTSGLRDIARQPFEALQQRRGFAITATSDLVQLPPVSDPSALKTLKELLAATWVPVEDHALAEVDKVIASTSDPVARQALASARAAAAAVDAFGEKLEHLRMELDELSGGKFGGEQVGSIPSPLRSALASALSRYSEYLAAFDSQAEGWLQRKVQEELGGVLITVKQRCSGLETEWNKVSLLGTSGLSGSYIEQREGAAH